MATAAAVAVLLAIGIAVLLYWRYPRATRRWFRRIRLTRKVLWSVFLIALAIFFLQSGILSFVIVGAVVVGYAVLYVLYEEPHEVIRDAVS